MTEAVKEISVTPGAALTEVMGGMALGLATASNLRVTADLSQPVFVFFLNEVIGLLLEAGDRSIRGLRNPQVSQVREMVEGGVVFTGPCFVQEAVGLVELDQGVVCMPKHPAQKRQKTNRFAFSQKRGPKQPPSRVGQVEGKSPCYSQEDKPIVLNDETPTAAPSPVTPAAASKKKRKIPLGGGRSLTVAG